MLSSGLWGAKSYRSKLLEVFKWCLVLGESSELCLVLGECGRSCETFVCLVFYASFVSHFVVWRWTLVEEEGNSPDERGELRRNSVRSFLIVRMSGEQSGDFRYGNALFSETLFTSISGINPLYQRFPAIRQVLPPKVSGDPSS